MATYNNFSLSRKQGKFYLKQSQPTEGYEEITYGDGKKTYHKYFDSIKGMPEYFDTKEVSYQGSTLKFLELSLEDGEEINKISVPLKNKGGYTNEAKALVSALNGYKIGESVTINPRVSTTTGKNGKEYENLNVYINYDNITNDGKNASTGYISYDDIPKPTSKVVAGDKVWDFTEQTEFYYNKINEIKERFEGKSNQEPKPILDNNSTFVEVAEDISDNLPF